MLRGSIRINRGGAAGHRVATRGRWLCRVVISGAQGEDPLSSNSSKKAKTLCDWTKKDRRNEAQLLISLIKDPTHYCTSCGRAANTKQVLCKPKPLDPK